MKSFKDISESTKSEQVKFDKIVADMIKPDSRLTPARWEELFGIFSKAEKSGLKLDKLSPMTQFNFKQWKKKQ